MTLPLAASTLPRAASPRWSGCSPTGSSPPRAARPRSTIRSRSPRGTPLGSPSTLSVPRFRRLGSDYGAVSGPVRDVYERRSRSGARRPGGFVREHDSLPVTSRRWSSHQQSRWAQVGPPQRAPPGRKLQLHGHQFRRINPRKRRAASASIMAYLPGMSRCQPSQWAGRGFRMTQPQHSVAQGTTRSRPSPTGEPHSEQVP